LKKKGKNNRRRTENQQRKKKTTTKVDAQTKHKAKTKLKQNKANPCNMS